MLFKFSFASRHQTIKTSAMLYPAVILPQYNVTISGYLVDTIHRMSSFMVTVKS